MKVFNSIESYDSCDDPLFLAIGMFDGVHIGHQAVIEACINSAKNASGRSGVLTFWPHPSKVIRPDRAVPQIMPLESKIWSLQRKGLDCTIVQPFHSSFASLEASEFVGYLKTHIPGLHTLFVGENFRFGRGRTGDIQELRTLAIEQEVHVVSMQPCKVDGRPVSSTRIRELLKADEFNQIRFLLGHPYTVIGRVKKGRQVGRSLGYPTLNIEWAPELKPPYGVYAVRLIHHRKQEQSTPGIANYGIRPTYGLGEDPVLEVHQFEETDISYEAEVAVEMIDFLRKERKFENQERLVEQIGRDVERAKHSLKFHQP